MGFWHHFWSWVAVILCAGQWGLIVGVWYVYYYSPRMRASTIDQSRARAPRAKGDRGPHLLGKGDVDPVLRRD